ncbi:BTAD domain-containing putative transcriptional regulator [Streptomyces sp. NPDC006551]|uniref:AfsR/SARP family transcriptional regulator n=1 Tax=Streptomyces sp. NPDC006551 TaxID=3157178 RepID=UPI0033B3857C
MRFGVLGPLSVRDGAGRPVSVPEAKARVLLGCLLAREGRPVATGLLIDALWGDRPPARAANALQVKVSVLRRALGRDRIVHRPPGYLLVLDEGEPDAARFRALVARAGRTPGPRERAALLDEALGLWRGTEAYADVADHPVVREEAGRLAEERLVAEEERAEARLESGDRTALGALAADLAPLVTAHPLRERLRAAQLRALYGAGRQSEALASYEALRLRLAEDLGVDPSPELAALHTAILRQDPSVTPPVRAAGGRTGASPSGPEGGPDPGTGSPAAGGTSSHPASGDAAPGGGMGAVRDAGTASGTGAAGGPGPVGDPAPGQVTGPGPLPDPASGTGPGAAGSTGAVRDAGAVGDGVADTRAAAGSGRLVMPSPGPLGERPAGAVRAVPLSGLVGRTGEVRELGELLGSARLVTLTGPGGVGKTRLAQEVAGDGSFVELAGHRGDAAELAEAVAAALGIREDAAATLPRHGAHAAQGDATQRLAAALRDRPTLLVLDNCEHVVDAVAELASGLLRAVPGLRILATSREPLAVPGEFVRPLDPLPPADAVRLFAERASAAAPSFALTDANRADVTEICVRLDGIPLALELAATRLRALSARGLAQRLGDRFRVLATGRRGVPARQQTLRAVIDWSWELLSAPERIVLRRLSVQRDGCTLDAAEAVCGDGTALDVVELLGRLVDRSLVIRDGERYRMLESIAAYATERLDEMGDGDAVRERHRAYYLDLAERAAPLLRGPGQREWLRRLDAERANLRAAFDAAPDRFAVALSWYWLLSGRLREGRRQLAAAQGPEARVLAAAFALLCGEKAGTSDLPYGSIGDPGARARARWLVAYGHFNTGDLAESERLVAEVGDADPWARAAVHTLRAAQALLRGDLAAQGRHGREGRALFRALGDRWGESQSVSPLAALAEIDGDYALAARLHEEGLRLAEELGLAAERSARLSGLGRLALLAGDVERAAELHERARQGAAEHGYKFGEIYAEMGLALGARRAGRLDEAEERLLRIREWYREVSSEEGNHLILAELGFVAELRGDAATARTWHLRALTAARATRDPRARALALEGLAGAESLAATERLPGGKLLANTEHVAGAKGPVGPETPAGGGRLAGARAPAGREPDAKRLADAKASTDTEPLADTEPLGAESPAGTESLADTERLAAGKTPAGTEPLAGAEPLADANAFVEAEAPTGTEPPVGHEPLVDGASRAAWLLAAAARLRVGAGAPLAPPERGDVGRIEARLSRLARIEARTSARRR